MGRVSTLSDLRLDGMLIQTPPPNIVDLGTAVMMRYLDRLDVCTFSNVLDLTDLSVPKKRIMVQKAVGKHKAKYRLVYRLRSLDDEPIIIVHEARVEHGDDAISVFTLYFLRMKTVWLTCCGNDQDHT